MKKTAINKRLEFRLSVLVGLILLMLSLVAGAITFHYAFRHQINVAATQQDQLVRTIQAQAEVAVFAANSHIAEGVINGLLANPLIVAARIEANEGGFKVEHGSRSNIHFQEGKRYPLFSPVDQIEAIGSLLLVQNSAQIETTARNTALLLTLLLLGQVLLTAIIMTLVLRAMAIHPITQLANAVAEITPGSSARLPDMKAHSEDEIGLLTQRVNALLDAAESAINQVKTQHKELERMATHDFLTGLPTLRLAEDRLRIACANADRMDKKVALLFIDLDGFKAINDTLGHEAGDEVLREAARAMQQCIRAQDTIGRIGGDEFLIILGGISRAEEAAGVAEKLIAALTRKIATAEQALDLGASIGIALYPDHANHADTLRRAADLAMYTVKRSGKGAYAFA